MYATERHRTIAPTLRRRRIAYGCVRTNLVSFECRQVRSRRETSRAGRHDCLGRLEIPYAIPLLFGVPRRVELRGNILVIAGRTSFWRRRRLDVLKSDRGARREADDQAA